MGTQGFLSFLLVVFMCLMCSSHGRDFYVGGKDGWVLNPSENYSTWAGKNRFLTNDSLVFRYKKGEDSVLVVKKEDYDKCNTKNPISNYDDGNSVFKFDRSGPFYFISGSPGKCGNGQKMEVVVLAMKGPHTPPISPSPPAAAPEPTSKSPPPPSNSPAAAPGPTSKSPPPPSNSPAAAPQPTSKSPPPPSNSPGSAPEPTSKSPPSPSNSPGSAPEPTSNSPPSPSNSPESVTSPSPSNSPGSVTSPSPSNSPGSVTSPSPSNPSGSVTSPPSPTPSSAPPLLSMTSGVPLGVAMALVFGSLVGSF